jgi:putative phage-type endonuclease
MSAIVRLVQGSQEWHQHRLHHRNASETPAVLGVSPWLTAYQLWQIKTGRARQREVSSAMAHGTRLEPQAREAYEQLTGLVMEPLVMVDGEYSASLDGITLNGELIVELKCPKSRDSKLLQDARSGRVPIHVYWQLQHQLMVSTAELAHLYVYDGNNGILLEQRPEASAWDTIRQAWDRFTDLVRTDQSPLLTERDTVVCMDAEWVTAAREYVEIKKLADDTAAALDAAKQQLVALARHSSESGGGVSVSRFMKIGAIEYKRIPELASVDLDRYRGVGREETRVTVMK